MADTPLKVAIIGKAPSSRALAPYGDPSFEIWTLSNLVVSQEVPRWDRHVEVHPLEWFRERKRKHGDPYYDWLCSVRDKPLSLAELDPDIPAGELFPKDAIVERFGNYFTNTVSWMIALAIHLEAEAIHVYGVDMAQDSEYEKQRPSCEYFLGWAKGLGIDTYVPPQCDMLQTPKLYGFDFDGGAMMAKWKARSKELRQRLEQAEMTANQAAGEAHYLRGALDGQGYYKQWIME